MDLAIIMTFVYLVGILGLGILSLSMDESAPRSANSEDTAESTTETPAHKKAA